MISAVRYGNGFGFIGFYIVRPSWRGRGYGIALWRAAMQRLGNRVVGLDGVVAQQANYRRSGFELAWNNVRYQGVAKSSGLADESIVEIDALHADAVAEYDAAFFPDDRRAFVRRWVAQAGSTSLALRRSGHIAGYGVARPCRSGHKIGPLFAEDAAVADALYRALVARMPAGDLVQLDIPAPNPLALDLVRAHEMQPVFETARMYTGPVSPMPIHRLYGITTFELG